MRCQKQESCCCMKEEQNYETSLNYPETDPKATIREVQLLTKIRKLNRAIGDALKVLYDSNVRFVEMTSQKI